MINDRAVEVHTPRYFAFLTHVIQKETSAWTCAQHQLKHDPAKIHWWLLQRTSKISAKRRRRLQRCRYLQPLHDSTKIYWFGPLRPTHCYLDVNFLTLMLLHKPQTTTPHLDSLTSELTTPTATQDHNYLQTSWASTNEKQQRLVSKFPLTWKIINFICGGGWWKVRMEKQTHPQTWWIGWQKPTGKLKGSVLAYLPPKQNKTPANLFSPISNLKCQDGFIQGKWKSKAH